MINFQNLPYHQPTSKSLSDMNNAFLSKEFYPNKKYQRYSGVWDSKLESELILSIIERCPIGQIILNEKSATYKYEIVDGLQRLTTINKFLLNEFSLNKDISYTIVDGLFEEFSNTIKARRMSNKSIRLKFKNLPERIQKRFLTTQLSVLILQDWPEELVIRYFRRVQSGRPLKQSDILYTIQTDLTEGVKEISENEQYLKHLGLTFENGRVKKDFDRMIYKSILEVLYVSEGGSLNQPSKLNNYFSKRPDKVTDKLTLLSIERFLKALTSTDREKFKTTQMNQNLKMMFCLALFGQFNGESDFSKTKDFIIDVVLTSKNFKSKSTTNDWRSLTPMVVTFRDELEAFSNLRRDAHSLNGTNTKPGVKEVSEKVSNLFIG